MTEALKIIAETEGVRTPTRKRTRKERAAAIADHLQKRSAAKKKKAPAKAKAAKPAAKPAAAKPAGQAVADITRTAVTANGGKIRSAGFDAKTGRLHVEWQSSIWEYPDTKPAEWKGLKATLADADVNTESYFRKEFRGRAASSRRVYDRQSTGNGASFEAPANQEVK
jgi:hypothetical protein